MVLLSEAMYTSNMIHIRTSFIFTNFHYVGFVLNLMQNMYKFPKSSPQNTLLSKDSKHCLLSVLPSSVVSSLKSLS